MILQLDPPLPLETPKGRGWGHLLIDYSQEHDLLWVVFLNENGECWTFPNADIRMVSNLSLGRPGYVSHSLDYSRFGPGDIPGQHSSALADRGIGSPPAETPGS